MPNKSIVNLNINKDDSNINDYLSIWEFYNKRPNKVTLHKSFKIEFEKEIEKYIQDKNLFSEIIPTGDEDIVNDKILTKVNFEDHTFFISYVVVDRNYESAEINDVTIFYSDESHYESVKKLISILELNLITFTELEEEHNLKSIGIKESSQLTSESLILNTDLDNIELYYSSKTFKNIKKSLKKFKKNINGLYIFYGERGTGKTSLINYLSNVLNRMIIFIPNNMIEHTINNAEFRNFLKKYNNSIIILDDCEMLFNDYFTKSNLVVNNLLQLVDGVFANELNLTFISLFNVESIDEIDQNLCECNNLVDILEFEYLSEEESNELANHLGDKIKYKNKTKLNDIIKKRGSVNNKKIGF
jgi:hypothetical protein